MRAVRQGAASAQVGQKDDPVAQVVTRRGPLPEPPIGGEVGGVEVQSQRKLSAVVDGVVEPMRLFQGRGQLLLAVPELDRRCAQIAQAAGGFGRVERNVVDDLFAVNDSTSPGAPGQTE